MIKGDRDRRRAEARDDAAARAHFVEDEVASVARVPASARAVAPSDPARHAAFAASLRDAMAKALRVIDDRGVDAGHAPGSVPADPPSHHADEAGLKAASQNDEAGERRLRSGSEEQAHRGLAAGCAMCRGECCSHGGDHAFLTPDHLAASMSRKSGLSSEAIVAAYLARLPAVSEAGSCVLHGERGCVLDRDQRSDICNAYRCDGLGRLTAILEDATGPVGVAAVRDGHVLRATVIAPAHLSAASRGV